MLHLDMWILLQVVVEYLLGQILFDNEFFEIPDVLQAVDDIWLSGNYMRQGRGIWASNEIKLPVDTFAGNISVLAHSVIEGHDRFNEDRLCISYMKNEYGIWKQLRLARNN